MATKVKTKRAPKRGKSNKSTIAVRTKSAPKTKKIKVKRKTTKIKTKGLGSKLKNKLIVAIKNRAAKRRKQSK